MKANKKLHNNNFSTEKDNNGFMDLNSLQSVKTSDEIDIINNSLYHLQDAIQQYMDDARAIWDNHVKIFIQSHDCNTLQYLSDCDDQKFVTFMTTQKTFKLMMIAKSRLNNRKAYLMSLI
jgi:hypothetical protein